MINVKAYFHNIDGDHLKNIEKVLVMMMMMMTMMMVKNWKGMCDDDDVDKDG